MGCLDGMLHRDRNDGQASASVSTARLAGCWEQACPRSQLLPCPVLDPHIWPCRQCTEWGHTREDIVPIVNMHDFVFKRRVKHLEEGVTSYGDSGVLSGHAPLEGESCG